VNIAYVGIGANEGDRVRNVQKAIDLLAAATHVTHVAPLYETSPVGVPDVQRAYINTVVRLWTAHDAHQTLDALRAIEHALGRVRRHRFGSRVIDCDLLLFANTTIATDTLTVPHPRMMQRAFVLIPLLDVMPEEERTWQPGFLHCTIPIDEVRRWIASDWECASKHSESCADTRNNNFPMNVDYR
jgi:2-amino-4-hydroxy-6-hydroxymethyldihydropteridine diphosphokinase